MKIKLRDMNPEMCRAWRLLFSGTPDVEIACGDIFDETADAIISPANSFGFMDGGIDLVYLHRFGSQLQKRLQDEISQKFCGELPVGMSHIIETNDKLIPFLACAPTMRVPESVAHTVNAYLAFRAALLAIDRHNESHERKIESILCPGLGTSVGEMPTHVCATQMWRAFTGWLFGSKIPNTIGHAKAGHFELLCRRS